MFNCRIFRMNEHHFSQSSPVRHLATVCQRPLGTFCALYGTIMLLLPHWPNCSCSSTHSPFPQCRTQNLPSSEVNSLWASRSLLGPCWALAPTRTFQRPPEIFHSCSPPTSPLSVGERRRKKKQVRDFIRAEKVNVQ